MILILMRQKSRNFCCKNKRAGYGDATSLRRGVDRLTVAFKNIMEGQKVKKNKAFWPSTGRKMRTFYHTNMAVKGLLESKKVGKFFRLLAFLPLNPDLP
jgi:hypothetical protein